MLERKELFVQDWKDPDFQQKIVRGATELGSPFPLARDPSLFSTKDDEGRQRMKKVGGRGD